MERFQIGLRPKSWGNGVNSFLCTIIIQAAYLVAICPMGETYRNQMDFYVAIWFAEENLNQQTDGPSSTDPNPIQMESILKILPVGIWFF